MTFKQRLPYYLAGFIAGLIIVYFILDKKETEFNYGPNARVLNDIRGKKLMFSNQVNALFNSKKIDSVTLQNLLKNGDVDMWNKIKLDTCTQYKITGSKNIKNIKAIVTNCDSIAIIEQIIIK